MEPGRKMGANNISRVFHKRNVAMVIICVLTLVLIVFAQAMNNTLSYSKNPKLDSILSQLLSSDNPQAFASAHDLYLKDGHIRIVSIPYADTLVIQTPIPKSGSNTIILFIISIVFFFLIRKKRSMNIVKK